MKYIRPILTIFFLFIALPVAQASTAANIAVVVNDRAITQDNITDRMRLIMASSGLPDNAQTRENLYPQVIQGLIEEELKRQEADRLGVEILQADIDQGFATIASSNSMQPEQFMSVLKRSKINIQTLYDQIRAQLAWTEVIKREVRPLVQVRDTDAQAALERMRAKIGTTEYLLAEIFLPVEDPAHSEKIKELADRLIAEMKAGKAPFFRVAQQFSKAAGAAQGGNLGWVQEGQLTPALDEALPNLEKNAYTKPIKTFEGYHILFLRDKRTISDESLPSMEGLRHEIGMERLERAQRQHFLKLKSAAFIEYRDQ